MNNIKVMPFSKKNIYSLGFLATFFISVVSLVINIEISSALTVDRVLATVNDEIISLTDYQRFVAKLDSVQDKDSVQEQIVKNLIEERIILQEAKRHGIEASQSDVEQSIREFQQQNNLSPEEFEKRITEEGMGINDYKKLLKENIISLKLIEKEVNSKIIITEKDILYYYNENISLFLKSPEKVQVKAIFLKMSDSPSVTEVTDLKIKSLKLFAELKDGESFDRLVNLYSDEPLKGRDGMLGEFEKGELIPALDQQIKDLKEGEISEPIWTKEGVYIIKLKRKIQASYTPVEEAKETIYTTLYGKKREEIFNTWMNSLWSKTSVKIK